MTKQEKTKLRKAMTHLLETNNTGWEDGMRILTELLTGKPSKMPKEKSVSIYDFCKLAIEKEATNA